MAAREWRRTPVGQLANEVQRYGRRPEIMQRGLAKRIERLAGAGVLKDIQRHGGVERYALSKAVQGALATVFRAMGPLGPVLQAVVDAESRGRGVARQLEAGVKFLEAFGYQVTPPPSGPAARSLRTLRDRGIVAPPEIEPPEPPPLPEPGERRTPDVRHVPIWPEEQSIEISGRAPEVHDESLLSPEDIERLTPEVETPQSSNVFSYRFYYEPSGRHPRERRRSKQFPTRRGRGVGRGTKGILYVTYKAWRPGMKGKRPHVRGPMYAYFDVPASKWKAFQAAASSSAGEAVWTYLRVRGSAHAHKHTYRLTHVYGEQATTMGVAPGGVYVPRRITPLGLRDRAVQIVSRDERGMRRKNIIFNTNRNTLNRAEPDRGRPNRGR